MAAKRTRASRAFDAETIAEPAEAPDPPAPQPADPCEHWPTIVQCEADTGIPGSTLRRWCKEGKLTSVLRHGSYRIDPKEALELAEQEGRISSVEATSALSRQSLGLAPPQAPGDQVAAQLGHMLPAGVLSAASDVIRQGQVQVQQASGHTEEVIKLLLGTVKLTQQGSGEVIQSLLEQNKRLNEENASLRGDLKEFWETQKTDKIKAKELEIRAEAVKEGLAIGKLLAPQILAFAFNKANPTSPDASDRGILAVLQSLTQEQAIELSQKQLITDAQATEALGFRVSGTAQSGAPSRWMRTFSSEQIGKIVASGVLKKEQSLALTAAHEAATKLQLDGVAPATPAALVAPAAAAPAAAAPAAAAPAAASSSTAHPANSRIFHPEEVEALAALIAVILESAEVEVSNKGDKTSLLTFIVEKMGAKAPALKSIRWDRTP